MITKYLNMSVLNSGSLYSVLEFYSPTNIGEINDEKCDLFHDDGDDDDAFCIVPSTQNKRSRGRPKSTKKKVKPR